MSISLGLPPIKPPSTYQDWLIYFDIMKHGSGIDSDVYDALCMGSFVGSDLTRNALQKQIVETVNAVLDKGVKRFNRNFNENIAFNELSQTEVLFKRLKKDVLMSLFFTRLTFLPKDFRSELEDSVKVEMTRFWETTMKFLYDQSLEFSNPELENLLFLVKKIKLF